MDLYSHNTEIKKMRVGMIYSWPILGEQGKKRKKHWNSVVLAITEFNYQCSAFVPSNPKIINFSVVDILSTILQFKFRIYSEILIKIGPGIYLAMVNTDFRCKTFKFQHFF